MTETTFKFTEARLKTLPLPPDGQRSTYRDTEVKGLELRVTSNGVKSFCWYRRPKNEPPQRVTIGRSPEVTVLQARTEAQKHNAAIASGESPASERRAKRSEMLFSDLFKLYILNHAKPRKKTWREDQQRYDQYLAEPLGRLRVSAVTREVVSRVHAQITASGHSTVANRVLALVSSVMGRALEWSFIPVNPVLRIRRNKEISRDRFLRSDELPRFYEALMLEPNEVVRDFILMLLFTGARRANVLEMAWANINLDAAMWHIPETKNGEPLTVALTQQAVEVLLRRKASNPATAFVFPGSGKSGHLLEPRKAWIRIFDRDELTQISTMMKANGTPLDGDSAALMGATEPRLERARALAKALKLDCTGCRMPDARLHDLRRTMGSYQAMTGTSLNIIGKTLGHKNVTTTQIYARLQLDPIREAMTKATEKMFSGIELGKPAERAITKP